MKIECLNGPISAEENNSRALTLTVEEAFAAHAVRLGLLTPAGRRYLTPEITLEDGTGEFPLPACVLDAPGLLLAQIIAENAALQVAKSEIFAFPVERSIPVDGAAPAAAGLITMGSLDNALKDLRSALAALSPVAASGSYADLTDTPAIPTVPQNVSAFLNDAGYLTAHQSLADYPTAAQMNAAIAAAALEGAQIAVDGGFIENSANPVQSRVIQSALAAKQDKLTENTGTFSPGFTMASGSRLTVKQIGSVVYLQGMLGIGTTFADVSGNHLGDISGVDVPGELGYLPVTTAKNADLTDWHPGYLMAVALNGSVYVGMNVNDTDDTMMINTQYVI